MQEFLTRNPLTAGITGSAPRHRTDAIGLLVAPVIALLMILWPATSAVAQVFNRWVDDQGNVHYSDVIPPTEIDKGRTLLSPGGVRVDTVPPQKTPEQIQRERELERLRVQQERMREQQRADDRVLLNTFQSVDDLIMTRDRNLSDIDSLIQFKKSNIRRQQDWLTELRKEAADLERSGKPIPDQLNTRIESTEHAIEDTLAAIVEREQQKREIRKKFDRDLERLRQLKRLPDRGPHPGPPGLPSSARRQAEQRRRRRRAADAHVGHPGLAQRGLIMVPTPSSVNKSRSTACSTRPSRICAARTPPRTASTAQRIFGSMPPAMVPSPISSSTRLRSNARISSPSASSRPAVLVSSTSFSARSTSATLPATRSALML